MIPSINIADFNYCLPEERIAKHPLAKRDDARLLTCVNGHISQHRFTALPHLLPDNALLVFNETKVVPARLLFRKATGAIIELFCLEPIIPADYAQNFSSTPSCTWKCMVGNSKRWKSDALHLPFNGHMLTAELLQKQDHCVSVRFTWNSGESFSRVLEQCGAMPIPPYLKRAAVADDITRYQTVYARHCGSVAAPTAGLHFTPEVLAAIAARNIHTTAVTLHVGAGTFRPVKSETMAEHVMHCEPFTVSRHTIETLIAHMGNIIAIGTTSTRTLESLYFLGLHCLQGKTPETITQWMPYEEPQPAVDTREALQALLAYMDARHIDTLQASTQVLLATPYQFKVINGLLTNFHQPQSTLLLLVDALIGSDWKKVYDYALHHHFRFLSYGDSSLLLNFRS